MLRRRLRPLAIVFVGIAVAALAVILINLSWFDEPLLPELEALRKPRPAALEGNGYPFALGFWREPITLSNDEMRTIFGTPAANDGFDVSLGFKCQPRHRLDCAAIRSV